MKGAIDWVIYRTLWPLHKKLDAYFNPRAKVKTFMYPHPPEGSRGHITGDIWFDTKDKMQMYAFVSPRWHKGRATGA